MTEIALFFLVITSVAPIGIMYCGMLVEWGEPMIGCVVAGVSFGLVVVCGLLLIGAKKHCSAVVMKVYDPVAAEVEPLTLLIAYALPVVADRPVNGIVTVGFISFVLMVILFVSQQELFYLNPLITLLGYKFFFARNDCGGRILIVTRKKVFIPGDVSVVRLTSYLWLE